MTLRKPGLVALFVLSGGLVLAALMFVAAPGRRGRGVFSAYLVWPGSDDTGEREDPFPLAWRE